MYIWSPCLTFCVCLYIDKTLLPPFDKCFIIFQMWQQIIKYWVLESSIALLKNMLLAQNGFTLFTPVSPFLYPLKTLENHWFSDVFRGYGNGTLVWKRLVVSDCVYCVKVTVNKWVKTCALKLIIDICNKQFSHMLITENLFLNISK